MDFTRLKDFMKSLTELYVPGNSVVVYKDNKEVFRSHNGYSDLESKTPMTGDELFYIYSCSKVATVTAAMQLYERGCFLLNDPLSEYIPEYKYMQIQTADGNITQAKNPITIRHLFTMTAGLTYNFNTPAFDKARRITDGRMDTLTVARCIAQDPLVFEPGTHWNYSLCHDVLGAFVEVVSGIRFCDYVRKYIFEPLDMLDSCYHIPETSLDRMASQYILCNDDVSTDDIVELQKSGKTTFGKLKNAGKVNSHIHGTEYDSGGAGIVTTVDDYAKFASALANGGVGPNGEKILSSGTIELMSTNQLNEPQLKDFCWPALAGYGYGLGVRTTIDRAAAGFNGGKGEFGWGGAAASSVYVDPDNRLSMFIAQHVLNPQEEYYQPRARNILYACID